VALADEPVFARLDELEPDPENPRLPPRLKSADEPELLAYIARHYDAILIAESIARFGYFPSEPMVVMRQGGKDGKLRVLEGNRRLTALKGLAFKDVRANFRSKARWDRAAERAAERKLPEKFPVLIADDWDDAAPLIGYRHISGISGWDPYPKARFIARLVDDEERPFDEIAELVGESEASVRTLYRNYSIVEQARERFELPIAASAEELFGTFTAVLNRRALREFISAPIPSAIKPRHWPLPEAAKDDVADLLSWIYGGEDSEAVIDESRDLGDLARIVENEEGLAELRRTHDLDAADTAAGGPGERLRTRLEEALKALRAAERSIAAAGVDTDVDQLVEECAEVVKRLEAARSVSSRGGA
jgi:hypothetical protein